MEELCWLGVRRGGGQQTERSERLLLDLCQRSAQPAESQAGAPQLLLLSSMATPTTVAEHLELHSLAQYAAAFDEGGWDMEQLTPHHFSDLLVALDGDRFFLLQVQFCEEVKHSEGALARFLDGHRGRARQRLLAA